MFPDKSTDEEVKEKTIGMGGVSDPAANSGSGPSLHEKIYAAKILKDTLTERKNNKEGK